MQCMAAAPSGQVRQAPGSDKHAGEAVAQTVFCQALKYGIFFDYDDVPCRAPASSRIRALLFGGLAAAAMEEGGRHLTQTTGG